MSLRLCCMIFVLSTFSLVVPAKSIGQTAEFAAKAWVGGTEKAIVNNEVHYNSVANLAAAGNTKVTPGSVAREIRITYKFHGWHPASPSGPRNYQSLESLTEAVLGPEDNPWEVEGKHVATNCEGSWVYSMKVEKKVNGEWDPVGAVSFEFIDDNALPGGGDGEIDPELNPNG
jgi:hypothetical protein